MESFSSNPAFATYATCVSILGVKMMFSAFYTGTRRQASQGYINPEDATAFGKAGATAADREAPAVAHGLRIQRNDLENIPLFFAVGLVFVLSGASAFSAAAYFWTFTAARIAHTFFYMNHLQPFRALSFLVGAAATLGMIVRILSATV